VSCPEPDWAALAACTQDPELHAEGDVAVHTRMVEEALRSLPSFEALSEPDRERMIAAARWPRSAPDGTRMRSVANSFCP
jgi:hypothetical protein